MDVRSDEAQVRQLFDQMTASQPEAPPDRHSRIRRRARRHRLAQAAGTLAVLAAAAAVAAGVGVSASRIPPASGHRSVPGWALPWPDHRNGSVPERVLDGAVMAWRHQAFLLDHGASLTATAKAKVIWYAGQTVVHGQAVVAIFEVDSAAGKRLIAGWASASEVMHGQPGWKPGASPWVLYDVAAPRPAMGLVIGLNVHGTAAKPGRNPDNWIVLLAEPQVQSVAWSAPGPSSSSSSSQGVSSSGSASIGVATAARGLSVADTGQITGPVVVDQLNVGHHNTLAHPVTVGVPGNTRSEVPQLDMPARVSVRHGFRRANEIDGQGNSGTGLSGLGGRLAIRARCYGQGSLRLTFGIGAKETALGTMRCDDVVHELTTRIRLRPGVAHAGVFVYASYLTSYRVVLGTVR